MDIQKTIKQTLILFLLASSCAYSMRIGRPNTYHYPRPQRRNSTANIITPITVLGIVTLASVAAIAVSAYFKYQRAQKQYEILKRFQEDPYYDYEKLKDDARNLYFDQWSHSSTSLSSDYPAVWLEKDTTSNKNFLWWMFFNPELKELSNKLNKLIQHLRNLKQFQKEKKEYNEKYRQQRYRDERISLEREKLNQKKQKRR